MLSKVKGSLNFDHIPSSDDTSDSPASLRRCFSKFFFFRLPLLSACSVFSFSFTFWFSFFCSLIACLSFLAARTLIFSSFFAFFTLRCSGVSSSESSDESDTVSPLALRACFSSFLASFFAAFLAFLQV
jgi:hypothetical protein